MKINRRIVVPTGEIFTAEIEPGKEIEFLSLGDYGKEANVKADFLGLTKEINEVKARKTMPLSEKWVITISTQPGCAMSCRFCDVWKYKTTKEVLSIDNLVNQVMYPISIHSEITNAKRINVHYARMGEPTFNRNILPATIIINQLMKEREFPFHPVISTMMPRENKDLETFIHEWIVLKNSYLHGEAGLQLSINATENRDWQFNDQTLSLEEISAIMRRILKTAGVKGRKIALNFAISDDTVISGKTIVDLFNPDHFMCKITPIHKTAASEENGIITTDGYSKYQPYQEIEKELKDNGFDVLVFIPSTDEDYGRITCGNAILSGNMPNIGYLLEKKNEEFNYR